VALALLDSSGPLRLHSQFASGVNLRCEDYLIYVSPDPRGGACALRAEVPDVELLRTSDVWRWTGKALVGRSRGRFVELDPAAVRYAVEPPILGSLSRDPDRLARVRATVDGASWFDSGIGQEVGLPRVHIAIERLAAGAPDAPDALRSVVGMGVGLTPSADDALIGALCVLAAVGSPFSEVSREVDAWLRSDGAGATTDVSASYLRLALEGAFSAPLNRTVLSLGEDVPDARLAAAVRALAQVGATSGMDAAVGVQIAWEALVPTASPDRS
jgi:hypothetical protein